MDVIATRKPLDESKVFLPMIDHIKLSFASHDVDVVKILFSTVPSSTKSDM
jgi:hypothetical protein